mmetsp:Transcript_50052/g.116806  ORF Transcript_50052/g.116806 Transcript_50052/m.116806 type:complete len:278 (+) Transcript_50052:61-894(+)
MSGTPLPNPVPTAESGPALLKDATWFDSSWPFMSSFLFPIFCLLPFFLDKSPRRALQNPYVLGWLVVAAYCSHQMEEHAYDMRGWRYAFVPSFNHGFGAFAFKECERLGHTLCPLDPRITTYVNVILVWVGFVLTMLWAHWFKGPYAYAGLCNWGMSVVNAAGGHLLPWILQGYNPGAFQSLFMFGFGIYAITRCGPRFAGMCIFNGLVLHILTFAVGVNLVLKADFPEEVMGVLTILCSWPIPLAIARIAAPREYTKLAEDDEEEEEEDEDAEESP